MAFERRICTDALFDELRLPAILKSRNDFNPIGKEVIVDLARRAALIPRPYNHADYPDRTLNFYVDGSHHSVSQRVGHSGMRDELVLSFERDVRTARCKYVAALLKEAMRLVENDPNLPLPISWYRRGREARLLVGLLACASVAGAAWLIRAYF